MRTLLIGYDLNRPGQDYEDLIDEIKSSDAWWHHLDSAWLVSTEPTPIELCDRLKSLIDSGDELLVLDVTGRGHAWAGL